MSPSVFSCRRFAVALLVRCAEGGESRLQRPKANLSRWNLKVTTQAAGPGIWPVEARISLEGHDGNEKGDRRGCALRMRWASRGVVSRLERARIDGPPTKPGRVLIRAFAVPRGGRGREGEGVVRGPLDVSTKTNSAGSRLETKGKLGAGWQKRSRRAGFALKVRSWVRRIGGVCVCRAEVSWVELESYEMEEGGLALCKETAVARVSQADKRMLFDGIQSSRVCSGGMGGGGGGEVKKPEDARWSCVPTRRGLPRPWIRGGRAGLVRY